MGIEGFTENRVPQHVRAYSGRDCVKSLRSSYTGLCPQRGGALRLCSATQTVVHHHLWGATSAERDSQSQSERERERESERERARESAREREGGVMNFQHNFVEGKLSLRDM